MLPFSLLKRTKKKQHQKGASLIEYGMLVGLISVLSIGVVYGLGSDIRSVFTDTSSTLSTSIASTKRLNTKQNTPKDDREILSSITFVAQIPDADSNVVGYSSGHINEGNGAHGTLASKTGLDTILMSSNTKDGYSNQNGVRQVLIVLSGDQSSALDDTFLVCSNGIDYPIQDSVFIYYINTNNEDSTAVQWDVPEEEFLFESNTTYSCQMKR